MMDPFRSSILFFRAHKGAVILLIATLSLIFFSCLVLHSLVLKGNFEYEDGLDEVPRTYEIYYEPANSEITSDLINAIYQSAPPIEAVDIFGTVEVSNPNYRPDSENDEVVHENYSMDNSVFIGATEKTATGKFTLIGFEDNPNIPIGILRGSACTGTDDVLIDAWLYSSIDDFIISEKSTVFRTIC